MMDGGALGAAEGEIRLKDNASPALRSFGNTARGVDSQVSSFGSGMGAALERNSKMIGVVGKGLVGVGLGIAGAFGVGAKIAMDFDAQMSAVQSVTGATAEEFTGLREEALRLGAETNFSASEAAAGMEIMAKAGVSLADIMNGSAEDILNLSAAAGVDVPLAAETAAAAMNVFGISSEEAANIIAQSSNASAIDVNDWALAMKSAAPTAAALGVPIDELAAGLVILGDAGIKGEVAATALRNTMMGLADSTNEGTIALHDMGIATTDAQGNFRGLDAITSDLAGAWSALTQEQKLNLATQIAGKDGAAAFMTVMNAQTDAIGEQGKAFDDANTRMAGTGTASEQAKVRMDNLKGAIEQLKGTLETIAIQFSGPATSALRAFADGLNAIAQRVAGMSPQMRGIVTAIVALVGAFSLVAGGALLALPKIMAVGNALKLLTNTQSVVAALRAVGAAMFSALGPILLIVAAAALLYAAYKTNFLGFGDGVRAAFGKAQDAFNDIRAAVNRVVHAFTMLRARGFNPVQAAVRALIQAFPGLAGVLLPISRAIDTFSNTFEKLRSRGLNPVSAALSALAAVFPRLAGPLNALSSLVSNAISVFRGFVDSGMNPVMAALRTLETLFPPLVAVIEPAIAIFNSLRDALSAFLNGDFGAGFAALGDAIVSALQLIAGIIRLQIQAWIALFQAIDWGAVGSAMQSGLMAALSWLANIGAQIWSWLVNAVSSINWGALWNNVQDATATIISKLGALGAALFSWVWAAVSAIPWGALWNGVVDVTGLIVSKLGALGAKLFSWAWDAVTSIPWSSVWSLSLSVLANVAEWILTALGGAGVLTARLFSWAWSAIQNVQWGDIFRNALSVLASAGAWIVEKLGDAVAAISTWAVAQFTGVDWPGAFQTAISVLSSVGQWILAAIGDLGSLLVDLGTRMINGFFGAVGDAWAAVSAWFNSFRSLIPSAVGEIGQAIASKGTAVIDGFKSAIDTAWTKVTTFFSNIGTTLAGLVDLGPIETAFNGIIGVIDNVISKINDAIGAAKELIGLGGGSQDQSKIDASGFDRPIGPGLNPGETTPLPMIPAGAAGAPSALADAWRKASAVIAGASAAIALSVTLVSGSLTSANAAFSTFKSNLTTLSAPLAIVGAGITTLGTQIVAFVSTTIAVMGGWMSGIQTMLTTTSQNYLNMVPSITATREQIVSFVTTTIGVMGAWSSGLSAQINATMTTFRTQITSGMNIGKQTVIAFVSTTIGVMGGWSGGIRNIVSGAMSAIVGSVRSGMSSASNAIRSEASTWVGIINSAAGSMAAAGYNAGAAAGAGIANGIAAFRGQVAAEAAAIAQIAAAAMATTLKQGSPSRVTTYTGEMAGMGLVIGMRRMFSRVATTAKQLASNVRQAISPDALAMSASAMPVLATAGRGSSTSITYGDNIFNISAHDTEGVKREVMTLLIGAQQSVKPGRM